MNNLSQYIIEKLYLNKKIKTYNYHPKDKDELISLIKELLKERGGDADLNDIDTSEITDMSSLFGDLDPHKIDISKWNVSKVKDFHSTFYGCKNFNSDLSKWDVSSAKTIQTIFADCENFESDLSDWNVENLEEASGAFINCKKLDFNIDAWNPKKLYDATMWYMFKNSGFKKLPKWYKKYK